LQAPNPIQALDLHLSFDQVRCCHDYHFTFIHFFFAQWKERDDSRNGSFRKKQLLEKQPAAAIKMNLFELVVCGSNIESNKKFLQNFNLFSTSYQRNLKLKIAI
jgi:hypothetical protein